MYETKSTCWNYAKLNLQNAYGTLAVASNGHLNELNPLLSSILFMLLSDRIRLSEPWSILFIVLLDLKCVWLLHQSVLNSCLCISEKLILLILYCFSSFDHHFALVLTISGVSFSCDYIHLQSIVYVSVCICVLCINESTKFYSFYYKKKNKKEKIHRVRMSVLYVGLLLSVLILCICCDLVS